MQKNITLKTSKKLIDLVQAFWLLDWDSVARRQRDEAGQNLLRAGAVVLPGVHLPAEPAIDPGVLTGHVVHHVSGAGVNRHSLPALLHRDDEVAMVLRIRAEQGLRSEDASESPRGVKKRSTTEKAAVMTSSSHQAVLGGREIEEAHGCRWRVRDCLKI